MNEVLKADIKKAALDMLYLVLTAAGFVAFVICWGMACFYFYDSENPIIQFFINFFGVCGIGG
jgi:hypothetical protein